MSDEHQPEAVWVFPEKKSNKGRIWLIVGLAIAALVIVAVVLFFIIPRGGVSQPTPSPSVSDTAPPTPTPTPTATATEAPDPEQKQPPVPDPDLSTFAGQVQPRLDDAATGLGFMSDATGQEAVQIVDSLQQDAERLSDVAAPSSISAKWYSAVEQYAAKLGALRSAVEGGSGTQSALESATAALNDLRALVGL